MTFTDLLHFYERHLSEHIMPFWMKHCIDWEHGGINNVVADDGTVTSTIKYVWSQGRALWAFSSLFRDFDGDPTWLRVAHRIYRFLTTHAPPPDSGWPFVLCQDGTVATPHQSVYVDAFVASGFTAYARATGDTEARRRAVEIYERTSHLIDDHAALPTEPHPIPQGLQSHGPLMIFAHVYHELGRLSADQRILDRALELAEKIMTDHVRPDLRLLLEFVNPDGSLSDTDAGKTFLPGHAIESMWFLERIYNHHERADRIDLMANVIRWNLEKGWDEQYGGLFLARHMDDGIPVWHRPDAKVWWPHTEALYALLRFYELTGQGWCLEWYWRIHDYTFRFFPDVDNGEWHQNLDRRGDPADVVVKNLAVKDPFHLPRSLIYGIQVLRRLASAEGKPLFVR